MATMPDWVLDEANRLTMLADVYDNKVLAAYLRGDDETLAAARSVRDALDGAAAVVLAGPRRHKPKEG